ncbi:MAG: shikimate kinase [Clostridia bacterium]|nr:shikimate kinase [Clostridia bacterium]
MNNIILIGMPGCGKTTVGKLLATRLNRQFIDSDSVFQQTVHPNISEYFSSQGEDSFRCEETRILTQLVQKSDCIIATGGGIVECAENKDILQSGGMVVFIDRPTENIMEDIQTSTRPLLAQGKERLLSLYERRYQKYIDFSHIQIKNIGSLQEVTDKIINEVNNNNV